MIGATDGHTRNFSIFLGPDGFRLMLLYDILGAAPAFHRNPLRNQELQLPMSAGDRNRYRIDQLMPRRFDQTAIQAKVPGDVRRAVFDKIAELGPGHLHKPAPICLLVFRGGLLRTSPGLLQISCGM